MKIAILAGGIGSRLAPFSTPEKPKQFLDPLNQGMSLLQSTYNRYKKYIKEITDDDVTVITGECYTDLVREQLPGVNIIAEPCGKNTAPAIRWYLEQLELSDEVIITPSDHYIDGEPSYMYDALTALHRAVDNRKIALLGIKPTRPATEYGYIKPAEDKEFYDVAEVEEFKEKPDYFTAEIYLNRGFLWNSGVFMGRVSTFTNEFRINAPDLEPCDTINEYYEKVRSTPFDRAVLEKSDNVVVRKVEDCKWYDLGSHEQIRALNPDYKY